MSGNRGKIPIWKKYSLSVEEAAEYYGLGTKRLYDIVRNNKDAGFLIEIGTHYRIKRVRFEQFLDEIGTL